MSQQMFTGRITKICDAKSFKSGSSSRQFWAVENSNNDRDKKYPNVLAFEVFTSSKGPSERFANVSDLDSLKPGNFVRFGWEPKGNVWKSPKTGVEQCFVKLSVVTKIDLLGAGKGNYGENGQRSYGNSTATPSVPDAPAPDAGDDDDPAMPF